MPARCNSNQSWEGLLANLRICRQIVFSNTFDFIQDCKNFYLPLNVCKHFNFSSNVCVENCVCNVWDSFSRKDTPILGRSCVQLLLKSVAKVVTFDEHWTFSGFNDHRWKCCYAWFLWSSRTEKCFPKLCVKQWLFLFKDRPKSCSLEDHDALGVFKRPNPALMA